MATISFSDYLTQYQNFSEEQIDLIMQYAPAIRMLRNNKSTRSIVQSYPYSDSLNLNPEATLKLGNQDCPVEAYAKYVSGQQKDPAYVVLNKEIVFCIGDDIKSAQTNYLIATGQINADLAQATKDLPRFAPSVYNKVCFVTGAAQGLGQGIALDIIKKGAYVIVADLNGEGAASAAEEFNAEFGSGTAIPVKINVADEEDVRTALKLAVAYYGGLDVLISNAGIVRAGNVDELSVRDFNLVTNINYNAYFILVKYVSKIMKVQHKVNPEYWMDIIQINSKSGLVGSKNNSAYAGSKFGGIGLTQSFALELADFKIKVNAICPGNNLDGPLWSDPVNGLYVQYLKSGKVKGAKTVEDVRNHYLGLVPMRKGVQPEDLGKAVCYLVEQENETGQALPVSGGQEMLN
ncbi:MAG TPA: SDR family NAD(P)-dependent oxidoreductase [Clostridiaceae bacterium]|nr:SDR family NAD(P)-dependent oxidoreductase [Clostridiaceae bacterium]